MILEKDILYPHPPTHTNSIGKPLSASGRSMLEMLGVLAIIGVLSIGGLAGYKIAMNYHRANETIHDVMLRATNVPMKWDDYASVNDPNHQFKFADLKPLEEINPIGYTVKVWSEPADSDYEFRVLVENVPQDVCKRIINMNPTAVDLIKTGTSAKANPDTTFATVSDCVADFGRMGFYFDEDFKGINSSSSGGSSGSSSSSGGKEDECSAHSDCGDGNCCNAGGVCGACPVDPCADNPTSCDNCDVQGQDADGCLTCTPYDPKCDATECKRPAKGEDGCYTKCEPIPCEITECPEGQIPDTYDEYCTDCIKTCKDDPCLGKTGTEYECCSKGGEIKTIYTGNCCKTEYTYCTADETPDETCVPQDGCCTESYECESGCCGEDGKCTTENCPCPTCEELACEENGTYCVYAEDGCAKGCASDCPEGYEKVCDANGTCACIETACGTNRNGQKGAQSSSICCGVTAMEEACGADDSPSNHVWVGDVFALGDGTTNYCCCSENQSEECCQASKGDTYHLINGECIEYMGCTYEYENPIGATGPDCWYDYPKNLEGAVTPDCKVTGYENPEEHCTYTDENGGEYDNGYPCIKWQYECNCNDEGECETCEKEGKSCEHYYETCDSDGDCTYYSCIKYLHEVTIPSLNVDDSKCGSNEYCRIIYSENNCSSSLGSTGASTMYGICTAMDSNSSSCPQGVHLTASDLQEVEGCDTGEYCRLIYSENNCSSSIGSTGASRIYGVCTAMDSNSSSCPQAVHLNDDYLKETFACPTGYYCNLAWANQDCSSGLGSTGANPMYGACIPMTSNSGVCPN